MSKKKKEKRNSRDGVFIVCVGVEALLSFGIGEVSWDNGGGAGMDSLV